MNGGLKKNSENRLYSFIRENSFQLLGILFFMLNIWFAYKLDPLVKSIDLMSLRVSAIEESSPVTAREFTEVVKRLDRIETKIDGFILNR